MRKEYPLNETLTAVGTRRPKVLLVNAEFPKTYWGFHHSMIFLLPFREWLRILLAWLLPILGIKANQKMTSHAPLWACTVAAHLPDLDYRLVDMNVEELTSRAISEADYVFLGGMMVQAPSMQKVLELCDRLRVPTIIGGPFASSFDVNEDLPSELALATAVVKGELECEELRSTLTRDLLRGDLRPRYCATDSQPDMSKSPTPRFDLLKPGAYASKASIQVSRGCPWNCEFCDIIVLYGRRPRFKKPDQIKAELDAAFADGVRGDIFIVDDNFIGNPGRSKEVVQAILEWQRANGFPFGFYTEATINLAEDRYNDLVELMVEAGFYAIFVGIENPSLESLEAMQKVQNMKGTIIDQVRKLRSKGLLIYSGFILGADPDTKESGQVMGQWIQDSGISFAMAGLMQPLRGTQLTARLHEEGRLLGTSYGNQFLGVVDFQPKNMTRLELLQSYRSMLDRIYSPRQFYERAYQELNEWQPGPRRKLVWREFMAVPKSFLAQGIQPLVQGRCEEWIYYWAFMLKVLLTTPRKLPRAFALAISGAHFIRYTRAEVAPGLMAGEKHLLNQPEPDMSGSARIIKLPLASQTA